MKNESSSLLLAKSIQFTINHIAVFKKAYGLAIVSINLMQFVFLKATRQNLKRYNTTQLSGARSE